MKHKYIFTTYYSFYDTIPADVRDDVLLFFKYDSTISKYTYIRKNNWTGLGPRRKKLTSIINRATKLRQRVISKLEHDNFVFHKTTKISSMNVRVLIFLSRVK